MTTEPIGAEVAALRFWTNHPRYDRCPHCNRSIQAEALTKLAYAFERCSCNAEPYVHLTERIWHRDCIRYIPLGA